jgi:hypothetical protein
MSTYNEPLVARERPVRRSLGEAFILWLRDADQSMLFGLSRVLLLVIAGYAPFAALNDALAPFAFGIPLIDDLEIPIGLLAALRIFFQVRRYQSPDYRPRR